MAERTLRGARLGGQSFENERGIEFAGRQNVGYRCPQGHEFTITMSDEADVPALWDYAAGERTYIGYAMDPWVMACELGRGCTVEGVSRALHAFQDGPLTITAERLVSLWSDEMNDMICNDPELIRGSLDLAIAGAGLRREGMALTTADELAVAVARTMEAQAVEV